MAKDPRIDTGSRARHMPAEAPIKLRFDKFASFVSEYSSKLSLGGVFLKTDQLRPVGSEVGFDFRLVDGFRLFHGQGEVVWVRTTDNGPDRPKGVGVRFAALDDKGRELVLKILEEQVKAGGAPFEVDRIPADATVDWRPSPAPEAAPVPAPAAAPAATGFALMSSLDLAEEPTLITSRRKGGAEAGFDAPWGERLPEVPTDLLEEGAEAPVNVPPVSSPDFARPAAAPRRSDPKSGLFSAAFPDQLSKTSSPAHLGFMLDDAPEARTDSAKSVGPWDATQPVPTPDFAASAKTAAWSFDPDADTSRLPSSEDPMIDLEEPLPLDLDDLSEEPTMVGARRAAPTPSADDFAFDPPSDDGDLELHLPEPLAESAAAFKTGEIQFPVQPPARKLSPWEVAAEPPPWKTSAIALPAPAEPSKPASARPEKATPDPVAPDPVAPGPVAPEFVPFEPSAFDSVPFEPAPFESAPFEKNVSFEPPSHEPAAPFLPEIAEPAPLAPLPPPAIAWNPPPPVSPAALAQAAMPSLDDALPPLSLAAPAAGAAAFPSPAYERPSVPPAQYGAAAAWNLPAEQPSPIAGPHGGLFGGAPDEPWIPEEEAPPPTWKQRLRSKRVLGIVALLAVLAGAAYFLAPLLLGTDEPSAPVATRPPQRPAPPEKQVAAHPATATTEPASQPSGQPEPEVIKIGATGDTLEPGGAPGDLPATDGAPERPAAPQAAVAAPISAAAGSAQFVTSVSAAANGDRTELVISFDGEVSSSQVAHDPMAWTNDREKIVLQGLAGNRVRSPANLRATHVRSVRIGEHPGEIWVVIDKSVGSRVLSTSVRGGSVVVVLGR